MKIGDAMDKMVNLPYLAISGECTLEEISEKIADMRQIRGIYVVDNQGRLQGTLSLGSLIRNVIAARRQPGLHVRSLLTRITSRQVADLMDRQVIYARPEDDVKKVLDRMLSSNIKEIPVVDEQRRIIANISILDLWALAGR